MDDDDDTKPTLRVLALGTFLALPFAMLSETLMRQFLFPPMLQNLRNDLEPLLTPLAWVSLGLTGLLSVLGWRIVRAARARPNPQARLVGFGVAASLVQVPALVAVVALFFGAQLLPVVLAVALSSFAIVALYRQARLR